MEIGVPELLVIAVLVVLLFGPGRIANLGGELGTAIRSFRNGINGKPADRPAEQVKEGLPRLDEKPAGAKEEFPGDNHTAE